MTRDKSPQSTAIGAAACPECFQGSAFVVHVASRWGRNSTLDHQA